MFENDMRLKMKRGLEKVSKAIDEWGGCTVLSTGITGDDARFARAAVEAGVRMLEPNHPALALARGYMGVTNMHDAEQVRHGIRLEQMAEATHGVRNVVGEDIYITVGVPGGFTELMPVELMPEHFSLMSRSGADGLHIHKSSLRDLENVVKMAHHYGLLVDAYIGKPTDRHIFGLPAETPEEVYKTAKQMESIGVDMIGLMTGMSYNGLESGQIPLEITERLSALCSAVSVPTLAEGGINMDNFIAFKKTGVQILVVGTAIDQAAEKAVIDSLKKIKKDI